MSGHKLLPSGEWEGFYCYNFEPTQHKMEIKLFFDDGVISGSGIDDVLPFIWKGTYDLDNLKVTMEKIYATHNVFYDGDVDENGIWGVWNMYHLANAMVKDHPIMNRYIKGGFHIWPVKKKSEAEKAVAEKEKSKVLEKIYIERFK